MLSIFIGDISLVIGLGVLMLPLLLTELSRPRDAFLAGSFLLWGLVLVTSSDRFRGSPMLAILSGSLIMGRLGWEVFQTRWLQLSKEEKIGVKSFETWIKRFKQFGSTLLMALGIVAASMTSILPMQKKPAVKKKWIRPENESLNDSTQEEGSSIIEFSEAEKKAASD